jgi:hypothetical protein
VRNLTNALENKIQETLDLGYYHEVALWPWSDEMRAQQAVCSRYQDFPYGTTNHSVRKLVRMIIKEYKRPWIMVQEQFTKGGVGPDTRSGIIYIPNQRRTEPLTSRLHLATQAGICSRQGCYMMRFRFPMMGLKYRRSIQAPYPQEPYLNEETIALWHSWREECRTYINERFPIHSYPRR